MAGSLRMGDVVRQYGRFQLRILEFCRDDLVIHALRYAVVLLNEGNSDITELGSIEVENSDFPHLLQYLHEWQRQQRMQIAILKRDQSAIENAELKEEHLAPSSWESRYQAVEQALREIEPDYEPGEPNYELPDIEHHPETGRYCQPS